jgi:DNA-binding response OmpR family regulator
MTVFICEDNEVNYRILQMYLEELGYNETVWAKSIAEAHVELDHPPVSGFELYFIDVVLPDGLGTTIIERLRASACDNVFACSSLTKKIQEADLLGFGADQVFTKPISFEALKQRIDPAH